MADFGYDVADYCDVDPLFGTLDDFDRLLAEAHRRGLRVLIDWVPNHTSDQHPWFVEARVVARQPEAGLVRVARRPPDAPPNNWARHVRRAVRPGPGTTRPASGTSTASCPSSPTSNWGNPEVVAAMHDVLRFWLDRGVDGFRIDVVHCIGKDPTSPTTRRRSSAVPRPRSTTAPSTHAILRDIRAAARRATPASG